jgi:hypothetical protein
VKFRGLTVFRLEGIATGDGTGKIMPVGVSLDIGLCRA